MTIQKISKEEFAALNIHKGGGLELPETVAVRNLNLGDAIKFPCHWVHSRNKSHCNGIVTMYSAAKRYSLTIKATCRDGTVYVMRVA